MKKLSKNDILLYLNQVNEKLKSENKHGELLIVGGAAMTLSHGTRDATHDIDALFEPKEEIRIIVSEIAKENGLDRGWLNDDVKFFVTKKMTGTTFLEMSNLTIKCLDTECLLSMKLVSARPIQLSEDMKDSISLMKVLNIKEEKELFDILDKYAYEHQIDLQTTLFAKKAFKEYKEALQLDREQREKSSETHAFIEKGVTEVESMQKETLSSLSDKIVNEHIKHISSNSPQKKGFDLEVALSADVEASQERVAQKDSLLIESEIE